MKKRVKNNSSSVDELIALRSLICQQDPVLCFLFCVDLATMLQFEFLVFEKLKKIVILKCKQLQVSIWVCTTKVIALLTFRGWSLVTLRQNSAGNEAKKGTTLQIGSHVDDPPVTWQVTLVGDKFWTT